MNWLIRAGWLTQPLSGSEYRPFGHCHASDALRLPGELAADSGLASGRHIMLPEIVNSPTGLCRQSDV
jgi:hypothetical protein